MDSIEAPMMKPWTVFSHVIINESDGVQEWAFNCTDTHRGKFLIFTYTGTLRNHSQGRGSTPRITLKTKKEKKERKKESCNHKGLLQQKEKSNVSC
jgi:hypothetical protein